MKKNFLKILGLTFLTFVIITNKVSANVYTQEEIENNTKQLELANNIESFILNQNNGIYPEYYGEMYISDDSLNVVIQIVKKNIPKRNTKEYIEYTKIFNIANNIKIEYVSNTYNELNKTNNNLKDYYINIKNNKELNAFYVDTIKNVVVVDLKNINWKIKNDFKRNILSSSAIMLTTSNNAPKLYKTYKQTFSLFNNNHKNKVLFEPYFFSLNKSGKSFSSKT